MCYNHSHSRLIDVIFLNLNSSRNNSDTQRKNLKQPLKVIFMQFRNQSDFREQCMRDPVTTTLSGMDD